LRAAFAQTLPREPEKPKCQVQSRQGTSALWAMANSLCANKVARERKEWNHQDTFARVASIRQPLTWSGESWLADGHPICANVQSRSSLSTFSPADGAHMDNIASLDYRNSTLAASHAPASRPARTSPRRVFSCRRTPDRQPPSRGWPRVRAASPSPRQARDGG